MTPTCTLAPADLQALGEAIALVTEWQFGLIFGLYVADRLAQFLGSRWLDRRDQQGPPQ